MHNRIYEICHSCRVMPILTLEDEDSAVPLAEALLEGGVRVMEVTLRTEAALPAIEAIRKNMEEMIIGAGTIITADDVQRAKDAGAQFGVSPGVTDTLIEAVKEKGLPFLPGVATPTEMMALQEKGFFVQKFFPAQENGGAKMLKAVHGPLPKISFCPTGGITEHMVSDYYDLRNVLCVGGSWVAPKDMIEDGEWDEIKARAKRASGDRESLYVGNA